MSGTHTMTVTADSASTELVAINPATLEEIGRVPAINPDGVPGAVARARAEATDWQARTVRQRGTALLAARRYLLDHLDAIAQVITLDNGKPLVEAVAAELYPVADLLYYYAHHTANLLAAEHPSTGLARLLFRTSRLEYQPLGVVGVIAPWNYPFSIAAGTVAMALAAGNTVLLKGSEHTPLVSEQIAAMFRAAHLPDGVFTLLQGNGTVGEALCRAGVDKIFFTGSTRTGRRVMAVCAERPMPCSLELGGKDAMIVRADADLELASSGAVWGAFTNAGQCCASVERVYVDARVADDFIRRVVEKTNRLRQGLGVQPDTDLGPLTTAFQLETVERQVEDARARGATIGTGGKRNARFPGYFYAPTVLTGVDHTFLVMREETFGPLLPIMAYASDDEVVRLANDSPYGLTASVWSRDRAAAELLARRIHAGTVVINDCLYTHALCATPWGGRGESGFGRTHGRLGLLEMVQPFHLHTNTRPGPKDVWWYPYHQALYALMRRFAHRLTGSWWQRLLNLPLLIKSARVKKL